MSREIKFRAWDKDRKEYLSAGNVFLAINPGNNPKETIQYLDELKYPNMYKERFIIEQYTGLKDKNSKEIYEGDIVRLTWHDIYDCVDCEYIGKVIFREDTCMFLVSNGKSTDYEWWHEEKEVIGNIYENLELLESEANNE